MRLTAVLLLLCLLVCSTALAPAAGFSALKRARSARRSVAAVACAAADATIRETLAWLDHFVIRHNLCPFASGVRGQTRTVVCHDDARPTEFIATEAARLRSVDPAQPATTLIVLPALSESFAELMELQEAAEACVHEDPSAAALQLLAFHPAAEFDRPDDPADVALRSPHAIIHLLRDADVLAAEEQWAGSHAPEAAPGIQARNAAYLRGMGFEAAAAAAAEAARSPPAR